jgi:outer membrane lipoprotein-sorting protein
MNKLIYVVLFLFPVVAMGQDINTEEVLEKVINKHESIESFSAHVDIDVDVSFIKMPVKEAEIYFKRPDKFKVKAKSFLMLPKKGMKFSIDDYLKIKHSAIFVFDQEIEGFNCHMIKVVPLEETTEFVLLTLWIDSKDFVVRKLETTTTDMGTYSVKFDYGNNEYWLPVKQEVKFKLDKFKIPMKFNGKITFETDEEQKETEGTVTLTFSDYKVNTYIEDSIFEELEDENTLYH